MEKTERRVFRPTTPKLQSVEAAIGGISATNVKDLVGMVEAYLPFLAVATCTIAACALKGRRFFLHGRDLDGIAIVLERLWPELFEKQIIVYDVTSRAFLDHNEAWAHSYHQRLAKYDMNVPRIHVDTGFTGSVPRMMMAGGFNVEAIWLLGTSQHLREMPLPSERFDYWLNPVVAKHGWSKTTDPVTLRSYRRSIAEAKEGFPHELAPKSGETTWEQYLDGQQGDPLFWLYVKMLENEVKSEWAGWDITYRVFADSLPAKLPFDNEYMERKQKYNNRWHALANADAAEMPDRTWLPKTYGFRGYYDSIVQLFQDHQVEVSEDLLHGIIWQTRQMKTEPYSTFERIRISRRVYNGSLVEKAMGRKMSAQERAAWQLKVQCFLERLEKLMADSYTVVKHGGWLYCGGSLMPQQKPWLEEIAQVVEQSELPANLLAFAKEQNIPKEKWALLKSLHAKGACVCHNCSPELYN